MKQFARAVALITVFAVSTRAIGFAFRIFLSRVIGPEMLGIYQIAMSFFMVFLTLVASGLPLIISKEVAAGATAPTTGKLTPKSVRANIVLTGLFLSLATSLFICAVVIAGQNLFAGIFTDRRCIAILITLIPSLAASSIYTVLRSVWWGQKKFFKLGITELTEQLVRVVVFVIFLVFAFAFTDLAGVAALSYTVATFVSATVVVIVFIKTQKLKNTPPTPQPAATFYPKKLLKSAAPITGVRVATTLSMPVIAILLPMRMVAAGWTNTAALAQFGIAIGMTFPLLTIPQTVVSSLATALVPELSAAIRQNNTAEVHRRITTSLKFTLLIVFSLLPIYIALGNHIGQFLYANSLSGAYLAKAAWLMVPLALSQLTNTILNSMGAETKTFKHYALGSIALFAAVWFLPKYIGVEAVITGMGVCTTIASLLNLRLIGKLTKTDIKHSTLAETLGTVTAFALTSIPAALAGYFLCGLIADIFPLLITLVIAGGTTLATFLLFATIFNLLDLTQFRLAKTRNNHFPSSNSS